MEPVDETPRLGLRRLVAWEGLEQAGVALTGRIAQILRDGIGAHDRPAIVGNEDGQSSGRIQRYELRTPLPGPFLNEFGLDAAFAERKPDRPGERAEWIVQKCRHRVAK